MVAENPTLSDIVPKVHEEIMRVYWYYLTDASVLFQGNVDLPSKFLMFYIYRNIVGTFLTIVSWEKETKESEIATMVRLGNGYSSNIRTNYDPFDVDPFILSLKIGDDEKFIQLDEFGNLRVNGQVANALVEEEDYASQRDICFEKADNFLRKTYWYYLRGADLVNKETIITDKKDYFVMTYVNVVGTFLIITECNGEQVIKANTFVRLAGGGKPSAQLIPRDRK